MIVKSTIAGILLIGASRSLGSKNDDVVITSVHQLLNGRYNPEKITEITLEVNEDDWSNVYQQIKLGPSMPMLKRLTLKIGEYAWLNMNTGFNPSSLPFPNLEYLMLAGVTMGNINFISSLPKLKSLILVGGEMEYDTHGGYFEKSIYIDGSSAEIDELEHLKHLEFHRVSLDHIGKKTIRSVSNLILTDSSVDETIMRLNFDDLKDKNTIWIEKTKDYYGPSEHNIALSMNTPGQYLQLKDLTPHFLVGEGLVSISDYDETRIRRY